MALPLAAGLSVGSHSNLRLKESASLALNNWSINNFKLVQSAFYSFSFLHRSRGRRIIINGGIIMQTLL